MCFCNISKLFPSCNSWWDSSALAEHNLQVEARRRGALLVVWLNYCWLFLLLCELPSSSEQPYEKNILKIFLDCTKTNSWKVKNKFKKYNFFSPSLLSLTAPTSPWQWRLGWWTLICRDEPLQASASPADTAASDRQQPAARSWLQPRHWWTGDTRSPPLTSPGSDHSREVEPADSTI